MHLSMDHLLARVVAFTTILTLLRASTQAMISILLTRSLLTSTEHLFLLQVSLLLMEVLLTAHLTVVLLTVVLHTVVLVTVVLVTVVLLTVVLAQSVDLVCPATDLAPHMDQDLDLSDRLSRETMVTTSFPTLQLPLAHTTHLFSPLPQPMVALPHSVVMLLSAALLLMVSLPMVDLSSPQLRTLLASMEAAQSLTMA